MKNTILILALFLSSVAAASAQGSEALYDLFPEMPGVVDNDMLRELVNSTDRIPEDLAAALSVSDANLYRDFVAIGKILTKSTTILIFGEVDKDAHSDGTEKAMVVITIAFTTKTGEEVPTSRQSYLTMSGDDALHRVGTIIYANNTLEFVMDSTKEGEAPTSEVQVYKVGKKYLEFDSRR